MNTSPSNLIIIYIAKSFAYLAAFSILLKNKRATKFIQIGPGHGREILKLLEWDMIQEQFTYKSVWSKSYSGEKFEIQYTLPLVYIG